ncbi:MAG: NAD(P)/FAD-dependent oxidoreductase [Sphaerochaeta sp.]
MKNHYSVVVIGAGIIGSAVAYHLSQYEKSILVLEKAEDVSCGATKANSGIIHGGYTAKHNTSKGFYSIRGNRMYDSLSKKLGFPYQRIGSLVLGFDESDDQSIHYLLENGKANGVKGLQILTAQQVRNKESLVNEQVTAALYCEETGIASPYEAAIAFAETAVSNGVDIQLNSEVIGIEKDGDTLKVFTEGAVFYTQAVVNAAGLYSDAVAAMVGEKTFTITPRRGEYLLLKRGAGSDFNSVIFQTPTEAGKGVLISPTTWNNLLIGPNAEETQDREDVSNSFEGLKSVYEQAKISVPSLNLSSLIRYFAGIRATADTKDFIIGRTQTPGFYQAAGIDSPGFTSAPAIAEDICGMLIDDGIISPRRRITDSKRSPIIMPGELQPFSQIQELINLPEGNPERIVCRCEQVREKTITDALSRPIAIDSTDAVKRRTRAGMGACQGKFCLSRVQQYIAKELKAGEEVLLPKQKDEQLLAKLRKL